MYFPSTASRIDSRLEPRPETRTPIGTKLFPRSDPAASKICGLLSTRIRCDVESDHSDRGKSEKLSRVLSQYCVVSSIRGPFVSLYSRPDYWFPSRWEFLQGPARCSQLRDCNVFSLESVDEPAEVEN